MHVLRSALLFLIVSMFTFGTAAQQVLLPPLPPGLRDIDTDVYAEIYMRTNHLGTSSGGYGGSMAVVGEGSSMLVAVGAPEYDSSLGSDTGRGAVVFHMRVDGKLTSVSTLRDPQIIDLDYNTRYGDAIAMTGGNTPVLLAVGASEFKSGGTQAGAVFVYRHDNGVWVFEALLTPPAPAAWQAFGQSLALTGTSDDATLLVGAPNQDAGGLENVGAVYAYVRSGTSWTLQQVLTDGEIEADDRFGGHISIFSTGDNIAAVITAPKDIDGETIGAVSFFGRSAGVWTIQHRVPGRFLDPGSAEERYIAAAVTEDGNGMTAAISGHTGVDFYRRDGTSWVADGSLPVDGIIPGRAIAFTTFEGNLAVLATSQGQWSATNRSTGLYIRTDGIWSLRRRFGGRLHWTSYGVSVLPLPGEPFQFMVGAQSPILVEPFTDINLRTTSGPVAFTEDAEPTYVIVTPYGKPIFPVVGAFEDRLHIVLTPDNNCDAGAGPGQPSAQLMDSKNEFYYYLQATDDAQVEGDHTCSITTAMSFLPNGPQYPQPAQVFPITDDDYQTFLVNGSFEQGWMGWTVANKSNKDKVICDVDGDAYDDICLLYLTSKLKPRTFVLQQIAQDFTGVELTAGTTIRLRYYLWLQTPVYDPFKATIVVRYADGTPKTKARHRFSGTIFYSDNIKILDLVLASGSVKNIKVKFEQPSQGVNRRTRIDYIVLTVPDDVRRGTGLPVPLPIESFRAPG